MRNSKRPLLAGNVLLSATDVCALLSEQIEEAGSQSNWCRDNGVSTAYLSDVLNGRREPGKKILDVLGLEVTTFYRPKSVAAIRNTVLEWKCTVDGFVSRHEARVTSWARTSDYLKIEYEGWCNTEAKAFSGLVTLPLSTVESETQGMGTLGSDQAPFRLVGAFQNEDFTTYEGTWYEEREGYVATFSFDASV